VTVNLPKTAINSPPAQKKALSVSIDAQSKVYIDKAETPLEGLERELQRHRVTDPDVSVQLNADQAVNYGLVAKAISSIDRAGVKRLSVMTAGE